MIFITFREFMRVEEVITKVVTNQPLQSDNKYL